MDGLSSEESVSTERDLSTELNVSRTVLREAIKVLEAKGLVEVQQKVGVRIRPRGHWNLLDPDLLAWMSATPTDHRFIRHLLELRYILEPVAAELAASRASTPEIAALFDHLATMERTIDDLEGFIVADMNFHGAIFTACHNDLLEWISVTVGTAFRATRAVTTLRPGSSAGSIRLHVDVAEAIQKRDPPGARSSMERLLETAQRDINAVLRQQSA